MLSFSRTPFQLCNEHQGRRGVSVPSHLSKTFPGAHMTPVAVLLFDVVLFCGRRRERSILGCCARHDSNPYALKGTKKDRTQGTPRTKVGTCREREREIEKKRFHQNHRLWMSVTPQVGESVPPSTSTSPPLNRCGQQTQLPIDCLLFFQ